MVKLINRIPGSRHLVSFLTGLALRMHVKLFASLTIKQAFSLPCLVNLILKDTHIIISIYSSSSKILCYHGCAHVSRNLLQRSIMNLRVG